MTYFFNDALNPMLVRDLRQGLRSSLFTLVFLALQSGMAFFVIMGLTSGVGTEVQGWLTSTLTFGLVFFYILGLPMAALFALSPEFRENRIDLLKLTQMSARSLVWGKWLSLVTQGLLVFTSLLPYLILTYFFGGVDLKAELEAVGFLLAFSALLVAVCVALSCFDSMVFKVLLILGLLFLSFSVMSTNPRGYSGGPVNLGPLFGYLIENPGGAAVLLITLGLPFHWLLMEYGAYRLAPAAENHDTPQRLILFALVAMAGLAMVCDLVWPSPFLNDFTEKFFSYSARLAGWILTFAAATGPSPYPDTYRPFVRFGAVGKFVGRTFLYPGWPSSTPFIMLASAFCAMLLTALASARGLTLNFHWFAPTFLLLPAALLFPQVVGSVLLYRSNFSAGTRYFIVLTICLLVYIVCGILNSVTLSSAYYLIACAFPPVAWFLFANQNFSSAVMLDVSSTGGPRANVEDPALATSAMIIAGIMAAATMGFVVVRALRYWKHFSRLEDRAAGTMRPSRARPAPVAAAVDASVLPAPASSKPKGPTFRD